MKKYFGVAPGPLAEGNAVCVYAVRHKSSEGGPECLMPWKDRMNSLVILISLLRISDTCADRNEGCSRKRFMKELARVTWESNWLVRKAKLKVSTTSCQRRLFFQENFWDQYFVKKTHTCWVSVQLLQFYLQLWHPKPPM